MKEYFYYSVSENCMSVQACLDVKLEEFNIMKTFVAFAELDPCHYKIRFGIEKWEITYYLIDYQWGK